IINGKELSFDQGPVLANGKLLVPLRKIVESLGAEIKWTSDAPQLIKIHTVTTNMNINTNSTTVFKNRQIFFMEQPPVIFNGRTLVSLRFIAGALGADVKWDAKNRIVTIQSTGDFSGSTWFEGGGPENPDDDNCYNRCYTHLSLITGTTFGPASEEAGDYVLKQGLLNSITDIQTSFIRFSEMHNSYTMIVGHDESGREKAVWLSKSPLHNISLEGSAFLEEGLSQESIYSILQEKGIKRESVKKMYIAPYEKDQIDWFVIARQNGKQYNYCFDFKTGNVVIENIINLTGV
ncbi:MAG: stalk domain-containing protein, partial [Syntrophomonadaceae bacterium]|nr:stalk domain-containing protein [Syntrophomonadaceae bacterium]